MRFDLRESYAAGDECANVGTITPTLPDGTRAVVEGVYAYRIDGQGELVSVRAFWQYDDLRIVPPPS